MIGPARRHLIAGGVLAAAAAKARAATPASGFSEASIDQSLRRYDSFGVKASGGPGDMACGAWLEGELANAGLKTQRQAYDVPFAEMTEARLTSGSARAELIPQAIVQLTGAAGVEAPLALFDPAWSDAAASRGAIAIIPLPYRRWSAINGSEAKTAVDRLMAAGARGAVLVTSGPSGEAIALNVPDRGAIWDRPVACMAPKDAGPFLQAAAKGATGRLVLTGATGRRPAYNLVGRLNRGRGRSLVISTPRSGWFNCAGERGPGIAAWLELIRWVSRSLPGYDLSVVATSAHEYDNAGGARFIEHLAPKPAETALWVHLGANVAARDWRETNPPSPLPSVDPQRVLMATNDLLPLCAKAFAGQPGLEAVRDTSAGAAGELIGILAAGYPSTVGVFGSHRYHHTRADDLRCVSAAHVLPAANAFRTVIQAKLGAYQTRTRASGAR